MLPLTHLMTDENALDGKPARLVRLTNNQGMNITLMDIGATWLSCQVPLANGEQREVLLGVNKMADFKQQSCYMGATVGRFANRIAKGSWTVNGTRYQVSTNQAGNCLHGGVEGFDKRRWKIEHQSTTEVCFSLLSTDGEQGFPGTLEVQVTYALNDKGQVSIQYLAHTDKATPVNLTNHAYFNLQGDEKTDNAQDCRDHKLWIQAEYYLPTDEVGIPLDGLKSVEGTGFDFRTPRLINQHFLQDEQQLAAKGYDHSYFFDPARDNSQAVAALSSADGQVSLTVTTNKPAMQLYTGNWLAGTPSRSGEYQDYAGVALETQFLPDSPNHGEWSQPSCILEPEQEYNFSTTYHFISAALKD